MSEEVELEGTLVAFTEKAALWNIDGEEHWIPLSQTDFGGAEEPDLVKGEEYTFVIPAWLAEQDGLDT